MSRIGGFIRGSIEGLGIGKGSICEFMAAWFNGSSIVDEQLRQKLVAALGKANRPTLATRHYLTPHQP